MTLKRYDESKQYKIIWGNLIILYVITVICWSYIYIISSSIFASTVIGVNNISFLTSIQTIITLWYTWIIFLFYLYKCIFINSLPRMNIIDINFGRKYTFIQKVLTFLNHWCIGNINILFLMILYIIKSQRNNLSI